MDAPDRQRSLLALHGAVLLLLGLLCGLPAVSEELAGLQPTAWRAAHGALLLAGVWLLATSALLPSLVLPPRQQRALTWSLLVMAYAFATAVPHGTASSWIAYLANLATVPAGVLSALLTLLGARAALARQRAPAPRDEG